jgi:3-oxoacyl-(acyl-carrier-protein) synthase/phosphopantetheinyl transferase/malonyl CoA-acyl carrier protein transacylase
MINDTDIAVVGMSCVFPGAGDVTSYWQNIVNKVNAIQEAPESRIAKVFYDPTSPDVDRLYCNKGGFVDDYLDFDPIEFGIVPNTIQGTEPDHLLSLKLTSIALEDAGVFEKNISLERAGIIIGKGNFGGSELVKVFDNIVGGEDLVRMLQVLIPSLSGEDLYKIKRKYQQQRVNFGAHNVMGTVPNLVAALVANRFNFGGPAYTVDAACASSLIAIDNAIKELTTDRCDIVVAGAMHVSQNPTLWSVFSLLGAFSKSQVIRPFDKKADGVLAGEGAGFVVLRRLKDAIQDDQRIYAVLKGAGVSSDGSYASLMSPAWQGQIKAIKNAWKNTSFSFDQIGYIEAHGTATLLGDKTELQTLKEAFPYNQKLPQAGIGSVKSMIGHAMPAAGMAGFIKTVMGLYKGILPPTLHCDDPVDAMSQTRFAPVQEAIEWSQTDLPFIAGVNAFGFGGANSHVVIEKFNAHNNYEKKHNIPFAGKVENTVLLLARESKEELINALKTGDKNIGEGQYRLGVFNPDEKRIALALRIIEKDIPWQSKQDLWFTNKPLLTSGGKLAFMFPGLDVPGLESLKTGDFNALAKHFNLKTSSYYEHQEGVKQLLGLDEACRLIDASLKKLEIIPDVVAGHSVGEWTACSSVGMTDEETIAVLNERAINRKVDTIDAVFLSVNCGIDDIKDLLEHEPEIYLANDNCPLQIILCAKKADADRFRALLIDRQILSYLLPFATGYHSPFLEKYNDEVKHCVENIIKFKPAQIPIWSAITAAPYPKTEKEIQQLHIDFITKPVLFRQLVNNLYHDGVRMFVQVGAGSLTGFISDTLKTKEFSIIAAGSSKRDTLSQLRRVLVALFIEGKKINTAFLGLEEATAVKNKKKGFNVKLDLSFPFIDYNKVFADVDLKDLQGGVALRNTPPSSSSHYILDSFTKNMEAINTTQKDLLDLLHNQKINSTQSQSTPFSDATKPPNTKKREDINKTIEISLEQFPELIDHSPFCKRSITDNFDHEREPIVPLTMFIHLFLDTLHEYFPGIKIDKVISIKVFQFLWIRKSLSVTLTGKWINQNSIQFEIDQYIKATIIVDQENPPTDIPSIILSTLHNAPIEAKDIYTEGYMFHGPAYQAIQKIIAYATDGIKTRLAGVSGKGALLDNIGQTIALYYHFSGKNIMPFPVGFQEMKFHQNALDLNGSFECSAMFKAEDDEFLYSDIELTREGKPWCFIKGWQNRKSELDEAVWKIINRAEGRSLASAVGEGITLMPRLYKRQNTWFIILSHYLNAREIEHYNTQSLSKQKDWLLGRIAAKDAIRHVIEKRTNKQTHPASFTINNDSIGKPHVSTTVVDDIHISIAHKKDYAVAYASVDKPVGIDIEEIVHRETGFIDLVLHDSEKILFENCEDKDDWITRFWVAKEAYGKALGLGLQGNPKRYIVSAIQGETLTIENVVINTIKKNNFIIGYTKH